MKKLIILTCAMIMPLFELKSAWFSKSHTVSSKYPKRNETEPILTSLRDILKYHIKTPDNVNQTSLIVSGVSTLTALVMYYGADRIMSLPVLKDVLTFITSDMATPKDVIQGLSLIIGVFGNLGLYQNNTELRQKFTGSLVSIVLGKQVVDHKINLWNCGLQSLALLHLLSTASDLVVKSLRTTLRNIEKEEHKQAIERTLPL